MLGLSLSNKSKKFLQNMTVPKHISQINEKISDLRKEVEMSDIKKLQGSDVYYRVTVGEYRIIYKKQNNILYVDAIGKKNDGYVYKNFSH